MKAKNKKLVLAEIKKEKERWGNIILVENVIQALKDKKIDCKKVVKELIKEGKISEVKQGYIMMSKDISENQLRRNVIGKRISEIEESMKTLEIEIAGIKGNKPILTQREQAVINKLKEIFTLLNQPIQDSQAMTLSYKERELESLKRVIEDLKQAQGVKA